THNRYILTSEEESVANSASAHTEAIQSLFAFQSQPFCGSAGCNDYRICKNHLLLINPNLVGLRHEVNLGSKAETNIGAHSLCLLLEIDHHLRTLHAVGISRIILHLGSDGKLTPRLYALVKNGIKICTRGIDGGGIACGT